MKVHAIDGELLFGGNVKITFAGHPLRAKVYVGEGDDWQFLRYCRGFTLEHRGGEAELTLRVDALNVQGSVFASSEPMP